MPKLYDNLLAPEWRIAIYPKDLADNVLRSIRPVTGGIATMIGLTLATETIRPFYSTVNVDINDIEYVNALSVKDSLAIVATADNPAAVPPTVGFKSGQLSGEQFLGIPKKVGKYRFKSDTKNIDAFGIGLTDNTAIVGRDFEYLDGYYWFNEDPAKFGSICISGTRQILTLPCMGGELSTSQLPNGVAYRQCGDFTVMNAIQESLYGAAPNGMTNSLLYAIGGMKLSSAKLEQSWVEDDYYIGIDTNGEMVYAPLQSGVIFTPGRSIDADKLFIPNKYILVPTSLDNYIVLLDELNTLTEYPGIAKDFPQLSANFFGWELFDELRQRGCVFYTLTYINNNAGAQKALDSFVINPGKVIITTVAQAEATVTFNGFPALPGYTVQNTDTTATTNII